MNRFRTLFPDEVDPMQIESFDGPELKIPTKSTPETGKDPMTGVAQTLKDVVEGATNEKVTPVPLSVTGEPLTISDTKPWIENAEIGSLDPAKITAGMLRYNQGKPRASMIPPSFNYYTAQVLEYGAIKYERENWRKGCKWNDLIDSLQRHLDSFRAGEDCDVESALPHLAHMAFNVMALIEFYDKGLGTDDRFRYPDQPAGAARPGRVLQFRRPPGRE